MTISIDNSNININNNSNCINSNCIVIIIIISSSSSLIIQVWLADGVALVGQGAPRGGPRVYICCRI